MDENHIFTFTVEGGTIRAVSGDGKSVAEYLVTSVQGQICTIECTNITGPAASTSKIVELVLILRNSRDQSRETVHVVSRWRRKGEIRTMFIPSLTLACPASVISNADDTGDVRMTIEPHSIVVWPTIRNTFICDMTNPLGRKFIAAAIVPAHRTSRGTLPRFTECIAAHAESYLRRTMHAQASSVKGAKISDKLALIAKQHPTSLLGHTMWVVSVPVPLPMNYTIRFVVSAGPPDANTGKFLCTGVVCVACGTRYTGLLAFSTPDESCCMRNVLAVLGWENAVVCPLVGPGQPIKMRDFMSLCIGLTD